MDRWQHRAVDVAPVHSWGVPGASSGASWRRKRARRPGLVRRVVQLSRTRRRVGGVQPEPGGRGMTGWASADSCEVERGDTRPSGAKCSHEPLSGRSPARCRRAEFLTTRAAVLSTGGGARLSTTRSGTAAPAPAVRRARSVDNPGGNIEGGRGRHSVNQVMGLTLVYQATAGRRSRIESRTFSGAGWYHGTPEQERARRRRRHHRLTQED